MKIFWQKNSKFLIELGYDALLVLLVLFGCYFIAKLVKKMIKRTTKRMTNFDHTLLPIFVTTTNYLIYVIGFIIILDIFGVNTTSIIAVLGSVGLAIGFALKDTLSNIAAGIMLLILRPFKAGDAIDFGPVSGVVKEINLFTTSIDTFDGIYVSSPNSSIWGSSYIKNFSRNDKRRIDVIVGISYGDSIEEGLSVLKEIIENETRLLKEPVAQAMVVAMADSSVNLQLRAWTRNEEYWETLWSLNKIIKEKTEMKGLTIPFPQRDIHMINQKTL